MPIKIPEFLPARATLESENIFTITERRAVTQDIRPLRILLLKSLLKLRRILRRLSRNTAIRPLNC